MKNKYAAPPAFTALAILLIFTLFLSTACRAALPGGGTASPEASRAPASSPTPDNRLEVEDDGRPLPPQVLDVQPAPGQELPPGEVIRVKFDQPMDPGQTASALQVTGPEGEAVEGEITWEDESTLRFEPAAPLEPGQVYRARLAETASSRQGLALEEGLAFNFQAVGELAVQQVFPADGATDVTNDAAITVIFNRPVAPLVIAEEQAGLPQPLEITPAVEGRGEWISTSAYAFHPARPLLGATRYSVSVPAGLQDATGESRLEAGYSWEFTTVAPSIASYELLPDFVNPEQAYPNVLLDAGFAVNFYQPMDPASTEAALSLVTESGGAVEAATTWNEDFTRVVISPTARLALGTGYRLIVDASASTAQGEGTLAEGLDWSFTTIPSPRVVAIEPADGSVQPTYNSMLRIQFASPMRLDTVYERIIIEPAPDEEVQWWYNEWDWSLNAFFLEPSTNYTIRLLPGMEDIYGNATTGEQVARFRTAQRDPYAQLQMPYGPVVVRAEAPEEARRFYVSHTNIGSYSLSLYRLDPRTFTGLLSGEIHSWEYLPPEETLVWQTAGRSTGALDQQSLESFLPEENGGPLPTGLYFLGLDSPDVFTQSPFVDYRLVVVADANITLKTTNTQGLLWITGLADGRPLAGAPMTVYDQDFNLLAQGASDEDGLLKVDLPAPDDWHAARFAIAGEPGDPFFAFTASDWGSDVPTYEFGIWGSYFQPGGRPAVYVYTERPIYRPGQPVYFKGIVRQDTDLDYRLPDLGQVQVTIENFREVVYSQQLTLNEFGSFSGELLLDEQAALGDYTLLVRVSGFEEPVGSLSFNVAEYRRPEFQVSVSAEPEEALAGQSFTAQVQADYYSGGAVSGAEVAWTLTAEPYTFSPGGALASYSFRDDQDDVFGDPFFMGPPSPERIAEGVGATGPDGAFQVELPADLSESATGRRLIFEASVTDLSANTVFDRAEVIAHPARVYPGVKAGAYIGTAGDEQTFDLIAVDWQGDPVSGQTLEVEIVERRWYSVQEQDASGAIQWTSTVEEIPVTRIEGVTTDNRGRAEAAFTPESGGIYKARVTARDEAGRQAVSSAYIWVAGEDFIPWRQTNDHSLELVAAQDQYAPGDTAEILIASPFQGEAYALVTVERGLIRSQEVIRLESNSTVYALPVTEDMAPNVFVSVVVVKGVDETNPRPNFKMGIVELAVDTGRQELTVEVTPNVETAGPGDQVVYTVRTTDSDGQPVSAEVSLGLSDLATLSLMGPNTVPILDFFYARRLLNVWTSQPLVLSLEDYNAEVVEEAAAGESPGMGSGGGKGGGEFGVVEVRQDFPDTAFWAAHVVTNENGEATVSVRLPDNLTTWRMDARAATVDTLVGQGTYDLISTRPLLVRPQTPRFFVAGDQVRLGAAVHNNTGQDLSVQVSLETAGLALNGESAQQVEIPAGQQAYVAWEASVDMLAERVDLVFRAEGGGFEDASRPTVGTLDGGGLPVYRFEAFETVGTSGQLMAGGTEIEAIRLPEAMEVTAGTLTVNVAPSLAAGMTDGLTYLEENPYETVESAVSRLLPNAITLRALRSAGLNDPGLEAQLESGVNAALQRLYNWQNANGGWGWWPRAASEKYNSSHPLTSAYALLALVEAREAGFEVSQEVTENAAGYLFTQVRPMQSLTEPHLLNRQAFLLYVLARYGAPDVAKTVQLYEQRQATAVYARAFLLQAMHLIDPDDPRVETLLSDLNTLSIQSGTGAHWEEPQADPWNWNTDTRTTAIVLSALSQIDSDNPLNANAVRWLMSHRTEGRWWGTQETAWTLMALTNWMVASGELNASYRYAVGLNGERIGAGEANAETLRQTQTLQVDVAELLRGEANRLAFTREDGPGSMYYTAHLDLALPVEQVAALDRGIMVSRSYYPVSDLESEERFRDPISAAQVGDMVLVRVTLVAPQALHYVMVEDPLPAGLEAVDQSLNTSPQNSIPADYAWEDMWANGWGWWYFDHVERMDEKVVLSADYLPAGTYVYTYLARASTVGEFRVIPTTAQEIYFPEVYGRGEGSLFTVAP